MGLLKAYYLSLQEEEEEESSSTPPSDPVEQPPMEEDPPTYEAPVPPHYLSPPTYEAPEPPHYLNEPQKSKKSYNIPVPSELYAEACGRPLLKFDSDDHEHLKDLLQQCTKDLNNYRAEWRKYYEAALNALEKEDTEGISANLLKVGYYGRMVLEKLELENRLDKVIFLALRLLLLYILHLS